jgi:ATP-binding cassette subfamily B protein
VSAAPARRLLAPEVIQTSAMDCGPASLKCLLDGFGIPVSYGRLREACQTDVDGTSIDTLEVIAGELGLTAEQVMLPPDHLFLDEAGAFPGIVVVRLPNGFTHFVVLWRRLGGLVQVMDPGTGRRWIREDALLAQLHVHTMPVPAAGFLEWAGSDDFRRTLLRQLRDLGCAAAGAPLLAQALAEPTFRPIAALDAATRATAALVRSGAIARGGQAARVLAALYEQAAGGDDDAIPAPYWTARPAPPDAEGEPQVLLRGAVLLRVPGKRAGAPAVPRSLELQAALREPPSRPFAEMARFLRADGVLSPALLLTTLGAASLAVAVEALLFRGLLELGRDLGVFRQRLGAAAALCVFLALVLALEVPLAVEARRMGRRLETRLRLAFLTKLPRLGDRYLQSRPVSDMAERSHALHTARGLPDLGAQILRGALDLAVTTAGIAWLDPRSAVVAVPAALLALVVPALAQPIVRERDLRARSHLGALGRFYLDALLGLVPVRTHGAERAVRREHESLLVEWARAADRVVRAAVALDAVTGTIGLGLAALLLARYVTGHGDPSGVLLLLYWALNLPVLGQQLAVAVRQVPAQRNVTLRLLEPLGALEEAPAESADEPGTEPRAARPRTPAARREAAEGGAAGPLDEPGGAGPLPDGRGTVGSGAPSPPGLAVDLEDVSVVAGGNTILAGIDLHIPAGSHVAVVGASGAGKSTLVGLLLGWHRPASGRLLIDGAPLDGARLQALRREAAWVDPAVQLWNRPFLDNLRYGSDATTAGPLAEAIAAADLHGVLERLPDGLQTTLGEGGALVSGGEGQRVRLGRALLRPAPRLAILDEPFRGLDRPKRRALLARARAWWSSATLICVTHDVGETQSFARVIVIDGGRVVEDGPPAALAADPGSRYRALLDAEETVRTGLWTGAGWRRLRLEDGRLHEGPPAPEDAA